MHNQSSVSKAVFKLSDPCSCLILPCQMLHFKDGRCEDSLLFKCSMYFRFNLPVVHEHIWFPEFMRRHSDILNPTIFTLVPSHINIIPLLNNYNSQLVKVFIRLSKTLAQLYELNRYNFYNLEDLIVKI